MREAFGRLDILVNNAGTAWRARQLTERPKAHSTGSRAPELAPKRIRENTIAPGGVQTEGRAGSQATGSAWRAGSAQARAGVH
jgi:NAD(P)-dependent dehydrogenase (short-subunit alcohol dehydrogenase family)